MKKKLILPLVLATLLSGVPHLAQAQAGVVNSIQNPRQIAILYWYSANQTTSFPIPGIPRGFAFDGSNIWVGNGAGQGTVTKLRASDGACVGSCTFAVGGQAEGGVAFDGAYIWVSTLGNSVTKLRASDGACNGVVNPPTVAACSFEVGSYPGAVAFDGTYIWVANAGSNTVTKLRASDGTCNGVVNPPTVAACSFAVGAAPGAIAFDGVNIWVANNQSNSVSRLGTDGTLLQTLLGFSAPAGLAFDGVNLWVTNDNVSGSVTKLSPQNGSWSNYTSTTYQVGPNPIGIAFDGANVWVANGGSDSVTKLRARDGACNGSVNPPNVSACTFHAGTTPFSVVFDGANIWVANEEGGSISKL